MSILQRISATVAINKISSDQPSSKVVLGKKEFKELVVELSDHSVFPVADSGKKNCVAMGLEILESDDESFLRVV